VSIRTIIAGTRDFNDYALLRFELSQIEWTIDEVVSGRARGADRLGEAWARDFDIPCSHFPANWTLHGRSAGIIRNQQMANYAEAAVFFWNGTSRGTKHMIAFAERNDLLTKIVWL
jgi:hypothetical protein